MTAEPILGVSPLSALLQWYDFKPSPVTYGTYCAPTRTIPLSKPGGPPYEHRLGPTWGPSFTVTRTLPSFATSAAWDRLAESVAADVRARERRLQYYSDAFVRVPLELEW